MLQRGYRLRIRRVCIVFVTFRVRSNDDSGITGHTMSRLYSSVSTFLLFLMKKKTNLRDQQIRGQERPNQTGAFDKLCISNTYEKTLIAKK